MKVTLVTNIFTMKEIVGKAGKVGVTFLSANLMRSPVGTRTLTEPPAQGPPGKVEPHSMTWYRKFTPSSILSCFRRVRAGDIQTSYSLMCGCVEGICMPLDLIGALGLLTRRAVIRMLVRRAALELKRKPEWRRLYGHRRTRPRRSSVRWRTDSNLI